MMQTKVQEAHLNHVPSLHIVNLPIHMSSHTSLSGRIHLSKKISREGFRLRQP